MLCELGLKRPLHPSIQGIEARTRARLVRDPGVPSHGVLDAAADCLCGDAGAVNAAVPREAAVGAYRRRGAGEAVDGI